MARITQETIEKIKNLRKQGFKVREISDKLNLKIGTTKQMVSVLSAGFESVGEYRNYLARQRGFESHSDYMFNRIKNNGLNSYSEQKEYIALSKGFKSLSEYRNYLVIQQGFKDDYEYRDYLAKRKGFASDSERNKYLAEQRSKRPKYKKFAKLIKLKLTELGETVTWLAEQLGVSRQTVRDYKNGRNLPSKDILKNLKKVIKINSKTLEDILQTNY